MLSESDRAIRATRFGATDMSAICGVDPFRTAHDVWVEKVHPDRAPKRASDRAALGHRLEEIICQLVSEERGGLSLETTGTIVSPAHAWLCATPDRVICGSDPLRLVEAKLVGLRMRKFWPDDLGEVPEYVHVQGQTQMTVSGARQVVVGVLSGTEFAAVDIDHDEDLEGAIIEAGSRFHRDHIVTRKPPPPDSTDSARKALEAAWPKHQAAKAEMTTDMARAAREYLAASKAITEAEARKDLAGNLLRAYLGPNEAADGFGFRISWKASNGGGVDYKRAAEELGADESILKRFQRAGTRRLLVKEG